MTNATGPILSTLCFGVFLKNCPFKEIFGTVECFFLGKNFIMSIVASLGYCLEVVDDGGQGDDGEGEGDWHAKEEDLKNCIWG